MTQLASSTRNEIPCRRSRSISASPIATACVTWPALNMLDKGYKLFVVEDACGATSQAAQDAALSRMAQAGVVRMTTVPTVLEFQRDWAHRENYDALMAILKEHAGAYGVGIEYAYTMLHHAPQSAKKPQIVAKKSH